MKVAIGTGIAFALSIIGILLAIVLYAPPCGGFSYPMENFSLIKPTDCK